jgi:hypothetical protein
MFNQFEEHSRFRVGSDFIKSIDLRDSESWKEYFFI